jgi:hypothetical protein
MADTKEDVKLPDTEQYRVVIAAAAFDSPRIVYDVEGKAKVIYVRDFGMRGGIVDLIPREAKRLQELDTGPAVRRATEPRTYDELSDDELRAEAATRGLIVASSGADPSIPLREDHINALITYDQGTLVVHGAGTVAGGIATSPGGPVTRVDEVTGAPVGGPTLASLSATPAADLDVEGLAGHLKAEKLNAADTVAIAGDDPALARKVLEAERSAQGGDPRATVEGPLQKIIDG